MFGIGGTELFLILLFGFLIFGPDKLPQMGRTIGRALRQFRNAQDEMNKVIRSEVYDPLKDKEPFKNPFDTVFSGDKAKTTTKAKTSTSAPVKKEVKSEETFAERKARLAKEKEVALQAKADSTSATGTPSATAAPAAAATVVQTTVTDEPTSISGEGEGGNA